MKKIVLSLVLVVCSLSFIHAQEDLITPEVEVDELVEPVIINWQNSFKSALNKSRKEKKPILIYFTGSDWCGPCKILKSKLFNTKEFQDFSNENLVLYQADFPKNKDLVAPDNRNTNEQLSNRYKQNSFPTMIMINDKGEVLGRKNGIYMTEYYYPFFEEIATKYKK